MCLLSHLIPTLIHVAPVCKQRSVVVQSVSTWTCELCRICRSSAGSSTYVDEEAGLEQHGIHFSYLNFLFPHSVQSMHVPFHNKHLNHRTTVSLTLCGTLHETCHNSIPRPSFCRDRVITVEVVTKSTTSDFKRTDCGCLCFQTSSDYRGDSTQLTISQTWTHSKHMSQWFQLGERGWHPENLWSKHLLHPHLISYTWMHL